MATPFQRIRSGAIALGIVFLLSVLGFHFISGYSWLESVWMVVITISTVGYDEQTEMGAPTIVLMILVILTGVTAGAYTFGGFIQLMFEGEVDRVLGRRKMTKELGRLGQHIIICGFGQLGRDLATQLTHRGEDFVVVDSSPEKISRAQELGFLAVQGDATSEDTLEQVQLMKAKAIATTLPTDAENVFITLTARDLHPEIQIIAKSDKESSCRKLRRAGADKIVMPDRVGAQQMERMISRPSTADLVELFAEASHLEMELDELLVGDTSKLAGMSIAESGIKTDFNLLVVGLKDEAGHFRFNPKPAETISAGDLLLVIGQVSDINRMKASL
jgi:voltage-gated potassium channel